MIRLVTGKPGHGKSYYAVRAIRNALDDGKWVATNVGLSEGWADVMARTNWARRLVPGRCERMARAYEARLLVTHDLHEVARLRLPGCGRCEACRDARPCRREGRGLLVLDEAHGWLNARTWDQTHDGRAVAKHEAVAQRLAVVGLFTQHRKLGWDVLLITQAAGNLDSQVRSNYEYHTHLKNVRRFRVLGLVPVVPVNVFVAVTVWHDVENTRQGVETFLLSKKLARCYDTMATSHGVAEREDVLLLPDVIALRRAAHAS
jgi:hypothetical protein